MLLNIFLIFLLNLKRFDIINLEMEYKTCTSCNKSLSLDNYYRDRTPIHKISYRSKCKLCCNNLQASRIQNMPTIELTNKICSICNIDKKIDDYYKSYRHKDGYFKWCSECHEIKVLNKGKTTKIKRTKEYMINYNIKKKENIVYQFKYQMRSNLNQHLKKKSSKQDFTIKYIGCSFDFLKKWFEYNFDDKMNWNNRGLYWHIDHIKPCNSYDLTKQEDIYMCYNWTNLRPLEKYENISKGDKIDYSIINEYKSKAKIFLNNIEYIIHDNIYKLPPEVKVLTLTQQSEELGELRETPKAFTTKQ